MPLMAHGLFAQSPPPSREVLLEWLDQNGAYIHPALRIANMDYGAGWRLVCGDNVDAFDLRTSDDDPNCDRWGTY
jgi:hypothetical protein